MGTQTRRNISMPPKPVTRQGGRLKTATRKGKAMAASGDAGVDDLTEDPSQLEGEGKGSNKLDFSDSKLKFYYRNM